MLMIGMKLGWLVLESILLGYFLYFGSSAAFALALVMILIPLCSLPINLYVRTRISMTVTAQPNLKKGDSGNFVLNIKNSSWFPVLRLYCRIHVENQLNRECQTFRMQTWLPPKKEQQITLQAGSDYCGRLKISAAKVLAYDCFGLCGIPCKLNAVGYMTVQPDTFEPAVTLIPNANSVEDSDVYSQERPGNDLTETYQIREYVPGDSPRQVHWKLSNKFDRLIVRDPALPIIRNVLIFWERTGESEDRDAIDAQAEIIVSLCKGLLDQSIQFTIGWNDKDRNLCILHEIRDMDELVGIIPRLMRATGRKEGVSGAELLLSTCGHALCGHMVYLAMEPQQGAAEMCRYGHVTMLLGGETSLAGARMFDPVNYKEQLLQIEL